MARRKKELENNIIKVGDTVRITYKLSPFYGVVSKVEKILGNRSRPCYQCNIDGQVKNISWAFLEKIDIKENKDEDKKGLEKDEVNGDN